MKDFVNVTQNFSNLVMTDVCIEEYIEELQSEELMIVKPSKEHL